MTELQLLCEQNNLTYTEVRNYYKTHRGMRLNELIEHCKKYRKYIKTEKPIAARDRLEQLCDMYLLDDYSAKKYRKQNEYMTDEQVIELCIQRNKYDKDKIRNEVLKVSGSIRVENLGLNPREIRALKLLGVNTVEQIQCVPIGGLKTMVGIGDKSIENIIRKSANFGISPRQI